MAFLDWHAAGHFDHRTDQPCAECGTPTPLRSHAGEPAHKVCAEDWNDRNPGAPRVIQHGRDLGTTRFHSDPAKKGRGHA
jgi:hypothetical protein